MASVSQPLELSIVLAGGAAKGAFEAGVLKSVLARGHRIRRFVAASSGALNGVALAAGIRDRRPVAAVDELIELWRHHGSFGDVVHPSLRDLFRLDGLSDGSRLHAMMKAHVHPARGRERDPVSLVMVVGRLAGRIDASGREPMTTFEQPLAFDDADFDSHERLEHVFQAATASATFPALFAPVNLPALGPCIDGGVVNNTPLHYAVDAGQPPDAVLVVCALPAVVEPVAPGVGGSALFTRLVDALINERLYRDLRAAEQINAGLDALDRLGLTDETRAAVLAAIGWVDRRKVRFLPIRPDRELRGGPFDAFFDAELREEYVAAGVDVADRVLAREGL
jgi:NTE family protein